VCRAGFGAQHYFLLAAARGGFAGEEFLAVRPRMIVTCRPAIPRALDRIIGDFRTKEARFWEFRAQIVGIENIRQTAVLPWRRNPFRAAFCAVRRSSTTASGIRSIIRFAEDNRHDSAWIGGSISASSDRSELGLRPGVPRGAALRHPSSVLAGSAYAGARDLWLVGQIVQCPHCKLIVYLRLSVLSS